MDNYEKLNSLASNIGDIHEKECAMNPFEINKLVLDVIEMVNNNQGEQGECYIDTFTIKAGKGDIILTLWEREFPIYIDLKAKKVEYDSDFDNCGDWTMSAPYFSIIGFIMQYLDNALNLGDNYND